MASARCCLHVLVVAAQFAIELQVDVPERGIEAEGVGFGLVEQYPLEARLPQRQRLGGRARSCPCRPAR